MACLVIRNEHGAITDVKAPNGESSLLFQELLKHHSGNTEKAFRAYAFTHTPTFKSWFAGSNVVDANGEPKIYYHDVSPALKVSEQWQKKHKLKEKDDISGEVGDNLGKALAGILLSSRGRFVEEQPFIDHRLLTLQERALEQYTGGGIKTISARPCFLHSIQPGTNPVIETTSKSQIRFVDMEGTYATEQNDDILMLPLREDEDVPAGGTAKLYQLKSNLYDIGRDRLADIQVVLEQPGGDQAVRQTLIQERDRLRDYLFGNDYKGIQGLKQEMAEISKIESINPDTIAPYIDKEFNRLDDLLEGNAEDADEAAEIIQFIAAVANVKLSGDQKEHPIYDRLELFDGDESRLPPRWIQQFETWGARAADYSSRLNRRKEALFEEIINANPGVQKHLGKLTFKEITKIGVGMKDTKWIDMLIMDAGTGIFSDNGIIPQAAIYQANAFSEEEESWSRGIAAEIDHVLPALRDRLIQKGKTQVPGGIVYSASFLGKDIAVFDVYQQRDEAGNRKTEMVSKYSFKWQDLYNNMMAGFMAKEEFSRTHEFADPVNGKENARKDAYDFRQRWLDKNSKIMNPALIPELAQDPEMIAHGLPFGSEADQQAHKAELVALLGHDYYDKMVKEQKSKIKDYLTQRKVMMEQYMVQEGVADPSELSMAALAHLQVLQYENDPFYGAMFSDNGGKPFDAGTYKAYSSYRNNIHVPLAGKGYYDENYAIIEGDSVLKQFYDIAFKATSGIWDRMDSNIKDKMSRETVLGSQSTLLDMVMDKDVKFMQMVSISYRRMMDNFKGAFGANKEDPFSRERVNAITKLPDYKVSSGFVQNNISRINNIFIARSAAYRADYNAMAGTKKLPGKLTKSTTINLNKSNTGPALALAMKYTGLTEQQLMDTWADTRENQDGSTYQVLRIGRALEASVVDDIVREVSFDLPRMIKMYSDAAAKFAARKKSLAIIKTMGEMYKGIEKQEATSAGDTMVNAKLGETRTKGLRTRAIAQWDNWFERAILGHHGLREELAGTDSSKMTDEDYKKAVGSTARTFFKVLTAQEKYNGKIYSAEDKEVLANLNKAIDAARAELDALENKLSNPALEEAQQKGLITVRGKAKGRLQKLEDMRKMVGKDTSASSLFDMLMRMVRWIGLSYNLYSGTNNIITGQVTNSVIAARGLAFPPEYINEIGLLDMIAGDTASKAHKKYMGHKAALAKVMMEDYNILQDASNELQKSSNAARFGGLRRLHGFYYLQKGEYYNQTPLAVAVLKDTKIMAADGVTESNVWDALMPEYDEAGKKWVKKLKPEFRTTENENSWEKSNGQDYFAFKARVRDVIKNAHGDFDPLTGMMAKSTHVGQASMMFHTFFPRMLYLMWGKPQDNIITGVMGQKGLMRSHTPLTAALQGAVVGAGFFGPIGSVVGAAAGVGLAKVWGRSSSLGLMQEVGLVSKLLGRKMLGVPLKLTKKITGKEFLTQDREAEFLRMQGDKFDRVDYGNFQANIQLLGMMCLWTGMLLLTKAAFWDDDDEATSGRRMTHNLLANEFMQLFDESAMYSNPVKTVTTFTDFAVLKYLSRVAKAVGTLQGVLEGTDTNLSGANVGESKSFNAFRSVMFPKVFEEGAGFSAKMQRQFAVSPFDHYFWGDEKNAKREIQRIKIESKEIFEKTHPGLDEEQLQKTFNKQFGKKRKGETYTDYLERLNKTKVE